MSIIQLNGKNIELPDNVHTIQDLLRFYKLENRIVIVEVNKDIVYKEYYASKTIADRDQVEIVHFVGGG